MISKITFGRELILPIVVGMIVTFAAASWLSESKSVETYEDIRALKDSISVLSYKSSLSDSIVAANSVRDSLWIDSIATIKNRIVYIKERLAHPDVQQYTEVAQVKAHLIQKFSK